MNPCTLLRPRVNLVMIAGTSVPNLVSEPQSSSRPPRSPEHSAAFSLYVNALFKASMSHVGCAQAAIANMEGVGGKPAWAWIFILVSYLLARSYNAHRTNISQEGLATVIAGAISFWVIEDFPDSAKFLSEAERAVVVRRLQSDDQYSAAGEKLQFRNLWRSIMDLKTWFGS